MDKGTSTSDFMPTGSRSIVENLVYSQKSDIEEAFKEIAAMNVPPCKNKIEPPYYIGEEMIGWCFDGGVMIGAPNIYSLENQRVFAINRELILGYSGHFDHFQFIKPFLLKRIGMESAKRRSITAHQLLEWFSCFMRYYQQKYPSHPLFLEFVVGGFHQNRTPFVGFVSGNGMGFEGFLAATGMSRDIGVNMIDQNFTKKQIVPSIRRAKETMHQIMQIIYKRSWCSKSDYKLAICSYWSIGVAGPYTVKVNGIKIEDLEEDEEEDMKGSQTLRELKEEKTKEKKKILESENPNMNVKKLPKETPNLPKEKNTKERGQQLRDKENGLFVNSMKAVQELQDGLKHYKQMLNESDDEDSESDSDTYSDSDSNSSVETVQMNPSCKSFDEESDDSLEFIEQSSELIEINQNQSQLSQDSCKSFDEESDDSLEFIEQSSELIEINQNQSQLSQDLSIEESSEAIDVSSEESFEQEQQYRFELEEKENSSASDIDIDANAVAEPEVVSWIALHYKDQPQNLDYDGDTDVDVKEKKAQPKSLNIDYFPASQTEFVKGEQSDAPVEYSEGIRVDIKRNTFDKKENPAPPMKQMRDISYAAGKKYSNSSQLQKEYSMATNNSNKTDDASVSTAQKGKERALALLMNKHFGIPNNTTFNDALELSEGVDYEGERLAPFEYDGRKRRNNFKHTATQTKVENDHAGLFENALSKKDDRRKQRNDFKHTATQTKAENEHAGLFENALSKKDDQRKRRNDFKHTATQTKAENEHAGLFENALSKKDEQRKRRNDFKHTATQTKAKNEHSGLFENALSKKDDKPLNTASTQPECSKNTVKYPPLVDYSQHPETCTYDGERSQYFDMPSTSAGAGALKRINARLGLKLERSKAFENLAPNLDDKIFDNKWQHPQSSDAREHVDQRYEFQMEQSPNVSFDFERCKAHKKGAAKNGAAKNGADKRNEMDKKREKVLSRKTN